MAKAEFSLGELAVNLGLKGMDKMLKGLNGVSAQFLLTKNAAEQAIKPIINLSKQFGNEAINYEKINSVTGISIKQLADLDKWAKLNHTDFNMITGEAMKLQQTLLEFKRSGVKNTGFDLLGIDPNSLDWQNPIQALEQISTIARERAKNEPALVALAFKDLGLNQELVYALSDQRKGLSSIYKLSNDELKTLAENQKKWDEINVSVETLGQRLAASGPIARGLDYILQITKDIHDATQGVSNEWKIVFDFMGKVLALYPKLLKYLNKTAQTAVDNEQARLEAWGSYHNLKVGDITKDVIPMVDTSDPYNPQNVISVPRGNKEALDRLRERYPEATVEMGDKNNYIVNINQYVHGQNSIEIAERSAKEMKQVLNNTASNNGYLR